MVVVAQLVRAPDCGSGGRRFETALPPILNKGVNVKLALFLLPVNRQLNLKKKSNLKLSNNTPVSRIKSTFL